MSKHITHDKSGFPDDLSPIAQVEVVLRDGSTLEGIAGVFDWVFVEDDADNDIVAYLVLRDSE